MMCFAADASPPYLPSRHGRASIANETAEKIVLTAADGAEFSAACAAAPLPDGTGIVVLPDVRGLYRFYVELTERFAEAGYSTIALDYFGRTAGPGERESEFDHFTHLMTVTPTMVQRDVAAAVAALWETGGIERLVLVGFCFGGAQACLTGTKADLAGTDLQLPVAGVVTFYGILNARRGRLAFLPSPLDHVHEQTAPLLGIYGGADALIPPQDIADFDAGLTAAGIPHELLTYEGAPHSFFDRRQEKYAESCADAWGRVLDFLARVAPSGRPASPPRA